MKRYHEPLRTATLKLPVRVLEEIRCLAGKRQFSEFIRTVIENYLASLKGQTSDKETARMPICEVSDLLFARDTGLSNEFEHSSK